MKKQFVIIGATVLVYLLMRRSFGNPNRHLKFKKKPDLDKILNYKFAN